MKRFASLMAWSLFVAAAIAFVSPADARPRRVKCACQNSAPQQFAPQACYGGSICLQYLLYEDDEIAMWLVDHFLDTVCEGDPIQEFLFTAPGQPAPQSCGANAFPQCTGDTFLVGSGVRGTAMHEPLGPNNADSYVKKLRHDDQTVKYPSNDLGNPHNLDTVWHPHAGARELEFDFVKAPKKGGGWVAIRIATGFVKMERIDFPVNAKPHQPNPKSKPHRIFDFGLESTKDPRDIDDDHKVTATKWDKYPDSETAFIVKFGGVEYYVLTQHEVEFSP